MNNPEATILIVDDEPQNRKLLEVLLRPEGYLTQVAASGEEALASVARCAPDLILLDVMMPGMDGYEVASLLKANPVTSSIPIIMVSALADRSARIVGLDTGAEDFLTKPVDRAELWLRVRNLLRLKTFGDFLKNHSLLLEQQVQARTIDLQNEAAKQAAILNALPMHIALLDRQGVMITVNATWRRFADANGLTGAACGIGQSYLEFCDSVRADDASDARDAATGIRSVLAGLQKSFSLEYSCQSPTDQRWFLMTVSPLAGEPPNGAVVSHLNITERKLAENRIAYLNRVYAMLSGINTLIVRVRERDELFRQACRIAVEEGGFRMAWIGVVDKSVGKIVVAVSAGVDDEHLSALQALFSSNEDAPLIKNKVETAIWEKKAVIASDLQNNLTVMFGKKYAEVGVRSLAVWPLIVAEETVGVLVLYAGESEFFQGEEIKLLTELAGDVAFAMDHIDKQERLDYLAYYDALTGLANRSLFLERVAQYLRSAASGAHQLALFLIDLEHFKNINDSLGRSVGDELLRQVGEFLSRYTGDAILLARIDADRFAAVLPEVRQQGDLTHLVEKMIGAFLAHSFVLNDAVFRVAVKVGVALFPDDGAEADTLFRNAEAALKKAKANGERYLFYTPQMTALVAGKVTMENQLRQALENDEFVLHYQPKVNLADGKMSSAEALIRWNDPRTGLVPPGHFIPILEETGLIHEVGRWALRQAVKDYLRWRAAGLPAVRIAVNVSPLQLRHRDFIAEVRGAIGIDPQAASGLELEITESVIMADVQGTIATLKAIRSLDIGIAIDDFGTGFSSLSYLGKLPVDMLKIDRSFVIDMTAAPQGLALVSTIISLAHALNLKVVAEGVETEEQSRLLRLLGCDEMQGFLFSKAVPAEEFATRFLVTPTAA